MHARGEPDVERAARPHLASEAVSPRGMHRPHAANVKGKNGRLRSASWQVSYLVSALAGEGHVTDLPSWWVSASSLGHDPGRVRRVGHGPRDGSYEEDGGGPGTRRSWPVVLTGLLTRLHGTGETGRNAGDARRHSR
jgi:hypothetical protein